MQFPRQQPIGPIRGDERRECQSAAISEQQRYLSYASDVLIAILFAETKVFVQAEADIVAIEAVGSVGGVEEVLLKGGGDGGFPRGGEAGEPYCEAGLAAEGGALGVG